MYIVYCQSNHCCLLPQIAIAIVLLPPFQYVPLVFLTAQPVVPQTPGSTRTGPPRSPIGVEMGLKRCPLYCVTVTASGFLAGSVACCLVFFHFTESLSHLTITVPSHVFACPSPVCLVSVSCHLECCLWVVYVCSGESGTLLLYDTESGNFSKEGGGFTRFVVHRLATVVIPCLSASGGRRVRKPEYTLTKGLVVSLLVRCSCFHDAPAILSLACPLFVAVQGSPVPVRSLCVSPGQDTLGLSFPFHHRACTYSF